MPKLCESWGENACRIEEVGLKRLGDFFRVTGKATNLLKCTLPHLMLKLEILDARGNKVTEDLFHITDRKLSPRETALFKLEGEWKRSMVTAQVTVHPHTGSQR